MNGSSASGGTDAEHRALIPPTRRPPTSSAGAWSLARSRLASDSSSSSSASAAVSSAQTANGADADAADVALRPNKMSVVKNLIRVTDQFARRGDGLQYELVSSSSDDESGESSSTAAAGDYHSFARRRYKFASGTAENQVELAHRAGTIWNCVRSADLVELDRLVTVHGERILWKRDTLHAMPLHMCFIYNSPQHFKMAEKIMNSFPGLACMQYEGTEYRGENVLHIAIVNQQTAVVESLMSLSKSLTRQLLRQRAVGRFFQLGQPCYYGELPLFFAACTNQQNLVELLLANDADINEEDGNGNTLLHLCVIHSLTDMYTFIKCEWKRRFGGVASPPLPLWKRTNLERHTPLTLAAKIGNAAMFSFLLEEDRRVAWSYGPVSCVLLPLEGVDLPLQVSAGAPSVIFEPPTEPPMPQPDDIDEEADVSTHCHRPPSVQGRGDGALELIVQYAHLDLLLHPRMLELVEKKWERFARRIFFRRFIVVLVYLAIFTATTLSRMTAHETESEAILHHDEDDVAVDNSAGAGAVDVGGDLSRLDNPFVAFYHSHPVWLYLGELLVVIGAMTKGWWEIQEMRKFGLRAYRSATGSALLENLISLTFCICIGLVVLLTVLGSRTEREFLAIACLAAWSSCFYFLLAFRLTGPMIVMIYQMLAGDVMRFVTIYLVFLTGYGLAFFGLFDQDGAAGFLESFQSCFLATLGDFDLDAHASLPYWWLSLILLVAFLVVVTILLLNLLIAMMADTYSRINALADRQWHLERARIVVSIEHDMTPEERVKKENRYWTNVDGQRFLQVQVVDRHHFASRTRTETVREASPTLTRDSLDQEIRMRSSPAAAGENKALPD